MKIVGEKRICQFDERVNLILLIMFTLVVSVLTIREFTSSRSDESVQKDAAMINEYSMKNDSSVTVTTLDVQKCLDL